MLIAIIILFGLAATLGVFLLTYLMLNKNIPRCVALTHGAFALTGIILLVIYSLYYQPAWTSVTIFGLAALGGLYLFSLDLAGKKIPKFIAIGHGSLALIGFITLLTFAYFNLG